MDVDVYQQQVMEQEAPLLEPQYRLCVGVLGLAHAAGAVSHVAQTAWEKQSTIERDDLLTQLAEAQFRLAQIAMSLDMPLSAVLKRSIACQGAARANP